MSMLFPKIFFGEKYHTLNPRKKLDYIDKLIIVLKTDPSKREPKDPILDSFMSIEEHKFIHEVLDYLEEYEKIEGFRFIHEKQKQLVIKIFEETVENIKKNPLDTKSFLSLLIYFKYGRPILLLAKLFDEDLIEFGKDVEITREELSEMLLDLLKANCQEYFNDLLQRKLYDEIFIIEDFLEEHGFTFKDLNLHEDMLYKIKRAVASFKVTFQLKVLRTVVENKETSLLLGVFLPIYDFIKQQIEEYKFTLEELSLTEKEMQELDRIIQALKN